MKQRPNSRGRQTSQRPSSTGSSTRPPRRRKLRAKPLFFLLVGSVFVNIFLLTMLLWPSSPKEVAVSEQEEVAKVGKEVVTRDMWMNEMEKSIGRETLQRLVNEKVMEAAAKAYDIEVTEEEVDRELALLTANDRQLTAGDDGDALRQSIASDLVFEKVLTHDIVIDEKEVKAYYEKNTKLYKIAPSYRTFAIVVKTKEEAEETKKEIKDGSDFGMLAKERSLDVASANLGGDFGFINSDTEGVDPAILKEVKELKENTLSDPIELKDGRYAIVEVRESLEGRSFSYDEVKQQIERMLAIEQLPQNVRPEAFWKEFKAKWIYDK